MAKRIRKGRIIKDFEEEVEILGEKFGKHVHVKFEEYDTWFHRSFGIVGPFISSIFGLIIFSLFTWMIGFLNSLLNVGLLTSIHSFLLNNISLFFLIFLFFSYTSYLSRRRPKAFTFISPFVTAVGALVGFWVISNALTVMNIYIGSLLLANIALALNEHLFELFNLVLVLGYMFFAIRMLVYRSRVETELKIMQRPMRQENIRRLYRSGRDRILGGVCGGIAEYLGVDPVIIRLMWIIGCFAWGFGILAYIIAWIIIPRNPKQKWDNF